MKLNEGFWKLRGEKKMTYPLEFRYPLYIKVFSFILHRASRGLTIFGILN